MKSKKVDSTGDLTLPHFKNTWNTSSIDDNNISYNQLKKKIDLTR